MEPVKQVITIIQAEKIYKEYVAKKKEIKGSSDGFFEVGSKAKADSDSESSDDLILPVFLGIKMADSDIKKYLGPILSQPFNSASVKKLSSLELEDINQIKQLLHRNFKPKTIGGWELVNELVLPCLNVERNEEVYEDSKIAGDFKAYK